MSINRPGRTHELFIDQHGLDELEQQILAMSRDDVHRELRKRGVTPLTEDTVHGYDLEGKRAVYRKHSGHYTYSEGKKRLLTRFQRLLLLLYRYGKGGFSSILEAYYHVKGVSFSSSAYVCFILLATIMLGKFGYSYIYRMSTTEGGYESVRLTEDIHFDQSIEDNTNSPFSVIAEEVQPVIESNEDHDYIAAQSKAPFSDDNHIELARAEEIVVPSSYPVTDAAKYFVPKEERGPGELGGPPPLDFPGDPNAIAISPNELADLYQSQGRFREAEQLYLQSLMKYKEQLGEEHPEVAASMNDLADLYQLQGRFGEAEQLYLQSLAMRMKLLGDQHLSLKASLNDLAKFYQSQGRFEEAQELFR